MTFAYDDSNLKEIIKTFYCENNNFFIDYLNGTSMSYICYDKNEEKRIKELMIKQAIERDKKYNLSNLERSKKLDVVFSVFDTVGSAYLIYDRNYFLIPIFSGLLTSTLIRLNNKNNKLQELKKYKMFLQLLDRLDEINQELEDDQMTLDITTVDDISYRKIKSIYNYYYPKEKPKLTI